MLSSPLASSFQSCRSPSSPDSPWGVTPPPLKLQHRSEQSTTAMGVRKGSPSDGWCCVSESPRAGREPSVESRRVIPPPPPPPTAAAAQSSSPVPPLVSTADTLLRMRERRRSSVSLRSAGAAAPTFTAASPQSSSSPPQDASSVDLAARRHSRSRDPDVSFSLLLSSPAFTGDGESTDIILRKQRVDRAMLSDREAERRHALHRDEQDTYMRFLVPFYQLLRECLRRSADRDDALAQCRRFSLQMASPSTPTRPQRGPDVTRGDTSSPRASQSASSIFPFHGDPCELAGTSPAAVPPRESALFTQHTTSAASASSGVAPSSRQRDSPLSAEHTDTHLSFNATMPPTRGKHTLVSSPSLSVERQRSAERVLVENINAEEKKSLDAAATWFVGRVSWLMAEETVVRAEVYAAEAYAWHCVWTQRDAEASLQCGRNSR